MNDLCCHCNLFFLPFVFRGLLNYRYVAIYIYLFTLKAKAGKVCTTLISGFPALFACWSAHRSKFNVQPSTRAPRSRELKFLADMLNY
jgi:hypothetical protein